MTDSPARPTFRQLPVTDERIVELLSALRETHMNGGALLAQFAVQYDGPLNWFTRRPPPGASGGDQHDFSAFFASTAVALALPELRLFDGLSRDPAWAWTGPFILDGQLTELLVNGGAYTCYKGPAKQAKQLAVAFCDAIFGDRYGDVQAVFYSAEAWSPWFYDVAWDNSWLILDTGADRVWLLCVTDTD